MNCNEPVIRAERHSDARQVIHVNELAFGQSDEANIVATVRDQGNNTVSLVAESEERIVGHILFSPVTIDGNASIFGLGLGPLAVIPEYQGSGIGSRLVMKGLSSCRHCGVSFVVVLGSPDFYQRFGFRRASSKRLYYSDVVPEEAFMVYEIKEGCLDRVSGVVRYLPVFSGA